MEEILKEIKILDSFIEASNNSMTWAKYLDFSIRHNTSTIKDNPNYINLKGEIPNKYQDLLQSLIENDVKPIIINEMIKDREILKDQLKLFYRKELKSLEA